MQQRHVSMIAKKISKMKEFWIAAAGFISVSLGRLGMAGVKGRPLEIILCTYVVKEFLV